MPNLYYLQVLVTLLVILGLMFALYKGALALNAKRFVRELRLTDRLPLDTGVSVCVVQYKEHEYLLGIGNKELRIIEKLK